MMELKNSMSEMRNVKQSICDRAEQVEHRLSELEDRNREITQLEENGKKNMKMSKESLCDLWDVIKRTSIRIIGIPEEEKG